MVAAPPYSPNGCVYLCYDVDGELIYIGQTYSWTARKAGHKVDTAWWDQVWHVEFIPAPVEVDRVRLERVLIQACEPRLNVIHTSRETEVRRAAQAKAVASRLESYGIYPGMTRAQMDAILDDHERRLRALEEGR